MPYGTLTSFDTLATSQQSLIAFGLDKAFEAIAIELESHNRLVAEMSGEYAERSTDRQRRYGATATKVMQELDEFGVPDAQKVVAGVNVGFPLRRYGNALQWTDLFLKRARADEMAKEVRAIQNADIMNVYSLIRKALFTPTNTAFEDIWVDHLNIGVKALINADGGAITPGPNAETFNGATHTHYLANATLTAAALTNLITTVIEHVASGSVALQISATDETAVRALTGFVPLTPGYQINADTSVYALGNLDMINFNNRMIGYFGAAEVWVKPWIMPNYAVCYVRGQNVLVFRTDPALFNGDLVVDFTDERFMLQARGYSRYCGMGVWNRTGAAILQFNAASYSTPAGL